jgi:anti-sigma factor RsiW
MLKLMAYADGELEGAERSEAEKLLATDPDSVRFVEQIGGLGQIVSLGYEASTAKVVAKFDVSEAVMALAKQDSEAKQPSALGGSVSSLAAAREKRGNGLKVGAGIAAALALAASIFVFAQHSTEETPMAKAPKAPVVQPGSAPIPSPNVQAAANPAPSTANAGTGVEVSTVNSPGNSVSVFYLPSANELSTSVMVWVDETGEK